MDLFEKIIAVYFNKIKNHFLIYFGVWLKLQFFINPGILLSSKMRNYLKGLVERGITWEQVAEGTILILAEKSQKEIIEKEFKEVYSKALMELKSKDLDSILSKIPESISLIKDKEKIIVLGNFKLPNELQYISRLGGYLILRNEENIEFIFDKYQEVDDFIFGIILGIKGFIINSGKFVKISFQDPESNSSWNRIAK